MRRYVRSATISAERGAQALNDLFDFPLTRHPHFVLLARSWQIRHGLTVYDAAYLSLAELRDAGLVTRDRALTGTGSQVQVEVV